ncbi:MAG: hypothetical protein PHG14_02990, partial [Desulfobacter postgatei]|uniref:hypothetical protein n=1 Tax=Desulfobacter postgatei TaxID=2293 RepID=UPI0023F356CE
FNLLELQLLRHTDTILNCHFFSVTAANHAYFLNFLEVSVSEITKAKRLALCSKLDSHSNRRPFFWISFANRVRTGLGLFSDGALSAIGCPMPLT